MFFIEKPLDLARPKLGNNSTYDLMYSVFPFFQVDDRNVGVWNFVDASEGGCKATHTGVDEATAVDHDGCYTFDGTGYATQRNIRNYDPRYLSVSMEFRSYDEDALLVMLVSDNQVRVMLIYTVDF